MRGAGEQAGLRRPCRTIRHRRATCVEHVLEARERGMLLRRQAVLFRSSHHSRHARARALRRNIPYVKYGGLKFLEAAHVKDVLAVLRWADNPRNRIRGFPGAAAAARCGPGEPRDRA